MSNLIFQHSSARLEQLIDELHKDDKLNRKELPGLADLLKNIVDPEVEVPREESVRGFLKVFWKSETDGTYSDIVHKYDPSEQQLIRNFVEESKSADECGENFHIGLSLGAREELPLIDDDFVADAVGTLSKVKHDIREMVHDVKEKIEQFFEGEVNIYEDKDNKVRVLTYIDEKFQNWGRTVENTPHLTCIPRTSHGVQEIVRYAKARQMNVRASGYRHSWSPVFGQNGQILISTLGLDKATMLPNIESLPGSQLFEPHSELSSIEFVGSPQPGQKRLVRVGTAVTNQMLRRWCNDRKLDEGSTLPLNVIMVEITLGGSNAPICHGAGRRHQTLSDLVYAIEYVDANGNLQTLSKDQDPDFMSVASGSFGLLGIITHLTLTLDPMSYAVMVPQKLPVMQAIPPPPGLRDEDIPEPLRISMTAEERARAQAEFEERAKGDFYSEWFWFPYTSKVWVNCWNTVEDSTGAKDYPSGVEVFIQWVETVAINILQVSEAFLNLQHKFPWAQATIISKLGLYAMPDVTDPKKAIKTKLPNALHFRRAIQNVRVRDMEFEIPLTPKRGSLKDAKFDAEIDWTNTQRAWWDAILAAYRYADTCPQRMPLEMRITGPSNVTMAPYVGHNLGSASIEILTLEVMKDIWKPYAQDVLDHWLELKDGDGKYLATRPHWAKEWYPFQVRGQPMVDYMKDQYSDAINQFRTVYAQIAQKQGWTTADARQRFSNHTFDQFFFQNSTAFDSMSISAGTAKTDLSAQPRVFEVSVDHE